MIYVLGDSHTQALGPRLRKLISHSAVRFQAFPGHSTKRAAAKASIPTGAKLIVIALGGNDFGDQATARRALVARLRLRNPGTPIVWYGPATAKRRDVDARHARQSRDQAAQLPGLGVGWIDSRPFTTVGHRGDGVHFSGAGYSRWARAMLPTINSALSGGGGGGGILAAAFVLGGLWLATRGPRVVR